MRTTNLAHRLILPSLAAISAALLYSLAAPGGSQAQVPTPTVPVPTMTSTVPNIAATATYITQITQQQTINQQALSTATPIPTITPATSVTPVTTTAQATATATAPSGATAAQDACGLSLASAGSGETIEFEQVAITLPSGSFNYGFIRAEAGNIPQVVVCNLQTSSTIYIDARTGSETARRANGDAGATSLNSIRAGVRARGSTSVIISPPNTGEAGLR